MIPAIQRSPVLAARQLAEPASAAFAPTPLKVKAGYSVLVSDFYAQICQSSEESRLTGLPKNFSFRVGGRGTPRSAPERGATGEETKSAHSKPPTESGRVQADMRLSDERRIGAFRFRDLDKSSAKKFVAAVAQAETKSGGGYDILNEDGRSCTAFVSDVVGAMEGGPGWGEGRLTPRKLVEQLTELQSSRRKDSGGSGDT